MPQISRKVIILLINQGGCIDHTTDSLAANSTTLHSSFKSSETACQEVAKSFGMDLFKRLYGDGKACIKRRLP